MINRGCWASSLVTATPFSAFLGIKSKSVLCEVLYVTLKQETGDKKLQLCRLEGFWDFYGKLGPTVPAFQHFCLLCLMSQLWADPGGSWLPCAHLPPLPWLQETLPLSGATGVGQRGVCFEFQEEALSHQHRKPGICEWMSRAIIVWHGVNYLTMWKIPACLRCHITTWEHICIGIKCVMIMMTGWLCPFKLLITCSSESVNSFRMHLRSHWNVMVECWVQGNL